MPELHSTTLKLAINYGDSGESTLYRLKKGVKIHVHPGPSLLGKSVSLYCNHPLNGNEFNRATYNNLNWHSTSGQILTPGEQKFLLMKDVDTYASLTLQIAGAFHFYLLEEGKEKEGSKGGLYVQVEPNIILGHGEQAVHMSLDSIRCQTILSKLLGPINTWEKKLQVAKECNYNMIHFTPIQELGASRSGYSLRDQLKVNPDFQKEKSKIVTFDDVKQVVKKIRDEWHIASICDIVLNHTANESIWIKEAPECTYNCWSCPHLRPAFLLDCMFSVVSDDVSQGLLEYHGVPKLIETEDHIQALRHQLHTNYLPSLKLEELYQVDLELYLEKFSKILCSKQPSNTTPQNIGELVIKQDPEFRRLRSEINLDIAEAIYNTYRADCYDEDSRRRKCLESFRAKLCALNDAIKTEVQDCLNNAIENGLAGLRYERVQADGPRYKDISSKHPLFTAYFTHTGNYGKSLSEIEQMMCTKDGRYYMAHNGWVMNSDPLVDFARPQKGIKNVYLRRELIAWGDSVKLRYGDKPDDCPYLWNHMKHYVETTAKIFDGVRLDNCHSTPINVASYMLDCARKVNPELFVSAELFTNSDLTDNIFVNKLGITSLIREALAAWDSHEQGRLVYRYGGAPVGAFFPCPKRNLGPSIAHALFLDWTHDNPSPIEKRSIFDLLPSAALVSMACCATGSNRGYDEFVPKHIHVVDEERQYQEWGRHVDKSSGMIAAREALNTLHGALSKGSFDEVFVDQMHPDIVAVTRHSTVSHETVVLVAHNAFGQPDPNAGPTGVRPLKVEGNLVEIILEAQIKHITGSRYEKFHRFEKDAYYINGINEYKVDLKRNIKLEESEIFSKNASIDGNVTQLDFENLRPGSVVAVRVQLKDEMKPHFESLTKLIEEFNNDNGPKYRELRTILTKLNLIDFNTLLYSCAEEEQDNGGGPYNIPGYGNLVYCGMQGIMSLLNDIAPKNDLGHPFCNNLRQGDWLIDYCHQRLARFEHLKDVANWLEVNLSPLKEIPRYMIPSYFDAIITGVYRMMVRQACQLMSDFIKTGSSFAKKLALGSVQFMRVSPSANLPKLSPNTSDPKPPERCATMAAGLPHFATGYMRCWGRDTFIAMRGLLFLTGRFEEARYMILGFGSCLRHGLIPNLLDSGMNARFNCRDAVWFWLYCIQEYVKEAPNGRAILKEKVSRLYPTDDSPAKNPGECDQYLYEIVHEALQVHFQGLSYRERNAGPKIDAHMTEKGFNNRIGVNPENGFVFGGNAMNCGTWMDKMGSSEKGRNRGIPTTPRDGSDVELVGLQVSVLRFLQQMAEQNVIPFNSVERNTDGVVIVWTLREWANKIVANFEKEFYVDENATEKHVNKRGMYKDTVGSEIPWADFQLRCNFPIALVVAPEMIDPKHAWAALENAKQYLLGPLGMRTLDKEDWGYKGNYDNSDDSYDPKVAHGANYHQGPEWLWPIGFYLRARLMFAKENGCLKETIAETWTILRSHLAELETSHWAGLPELTNENGSYCKDSCRTQAWSMSCVLEVLHDLQKFEKEL